MSIQASSLKIYCLRLSVLFLAALPLAPVSAAEPPPLQMGILPYLSSERLYENFLPLKDYLETQLKRRVVLNTAPNFKTYFQRAVRGDYDLYFIAPHLALLAEKDYGHKRVSRFSQELSGIVVVRHDSPVQRIQNLRGRTVVSPDELALVAIMGEQMLKENGLEPVKDYRLVRTLSHNNALLTVQRRGADAALVASAVFKQLPAELTQELRILTRTSTSPPVMAMANPRMTEAEYLSIKSIVLAFTRDGAGRKFFAATSFGDMQPITDTDMARLRPYLKITRERLK